MRSLIPILVITVVISESLAKNIPVAWNNRVQRGASVCRKPGGQCLDENTLQVCTGDLIPVVTVDCRLRRQGPYCNTDHNKCWRSAAEDKVEDRGRCPGQGLYPDPSDCRKYYDCSEARGAYETHTCSENEHFRFKSQKCKSIEDSDGCNVIDCRRRWKKLVKLEGSNRLFALCDPNSVNRVLFECPKKTEFNTSSQKCIVDSSEENESSEEIDDDDAQSQHLSTTSPEIDNEKSENEVNSGGKLISDEQKKQNIPPNTHVEQVSGSGKTDNRAVEPVYSVIGHVPKVESQVTYWDNTGNVESEHSGVNIVTESNENPGAGNVISTVGIILENNNGQITSVNLHNGSTDIKPTQIINQGTDRNSELSNGVVSVSNGNGGIDADTQISAVHNKVNESSDRNINLSGGSSQQIIEVRIENAGKGNHKVVGPPVIENEEDVISNINSSNNENQISPQKEISNVGTDSDATSTPKESVVHTNTITLQPVMKFTEISNESQQISVEKDVTLVKDKANNMGVNQLETEKVVGNVENQEAERDSINENSSHQIADGHEVKVTDNITTENGDTNRDVVLHLMNNTVTQQVNEEVSDNSNDNQQTLAVDDVEKVENISEIISADNSVNKGESDKVIEHSVKQGINSGDITISNDEKQISIVNGVEQVETTPKINNHLGTDDFVDKVKSQTITENSENREVSTVLIDDQHTTTVDGVEQVVTLPEINSDLNKETSADNNVNQAKFETGNDNSVKQAINGEVSDNSYDSQPTSIANSVEQVTTNPDINCDENTESPTDNSVKEAEIVTETSVNREVNSEASNISNGDRQIVPVNNEDRVAVNSKTNGDVDTVISDNKHVSKVELVTVTENSVNQEIDGEVSNITDNNQHLTDANNVEEVTTVSETDIDIDAESSVDNGLSEVKSETVTEMSENQVNSETSNISNDDKETSPVNSLNQVITIPESGSDVGIEISTDYHENKVVSEIVTENTINQNINGGISKTSDNDQQTSVANNIEQVTPISEPNGGVGTEFSADSHINKKESNTVTENTITQKIDHTVSNIPNTDEKNSTADSIEVLATTSEMISHIETSTDNSVNKAEFEKVTENIVKQEENGEVSNASNNGKQNSPANSAELITATPEHNGDEVTKTSADNNENNVEFEIATENTAIEEVNSEISKISDNDQQAPVANSLEEVTTNSENKSDVGTQHFTDSNLNKVESETVTVSTLKQELNVESNNISNSDQETSTTNGAQQVVEIIENNNEVGAENTAHNSVNDSELEGVTVNTIKEKTGDEVSNISSNDQHSSEGNSVNQEVIIPQPNKISDTTNEYNNIDLTHETNQVIENQAANDDSIILKDNESSVAETNAEQVGELLSENAGVVTDTAISDGKITMESNNISENIPEQIVNTELPVRKDNVQESVATDVNIVSGSINRNDGVDENDPNQENISSASIINNNDQSVASEVNSVPIIDDNTQTSENKAADETEVLDKNVGVDDAQKSVTNELVPKEPEVAVETIEQVQLQPEAVDGDVEQIVENPDEVTEKNTVNTVSPVVQSEDNTVASETDNGQVSDNNQLSDQVNVTESSVDVEVNADDVNQHLGNNHDGTQSVDAVSNDGSDALVPESTSAA